MVNVADRRIPMSRLFERADIEFLRTRPEFTRRMETAFRCRRCRIFRGYLRGMRAALLEIRTEFDTLGIECPELQQELALVLLRGKLRFAWAMAAAHVCLWRYRWSLGDVNSGDTVYRLESILDEIRIWLPELS
jgi:hypothetical protein